MAKYYLQAYHINPFQALNSDNIEYNLTVLKVSWWGHKKETITRKYYIPIHHDPGKYYEHWDNLIKTQKPFKQKLTN